MDYKSILLAFLAVFLWSVGAAPPRSRREEEVLTTRPPRWHDPCAGSRAVDTTVVGTPDDVTSPPFDPVGDYRQIREQAISSRNKADELSRKIKVERIRVEDVDDDLETLRLAGLPSIPANPNLTQNAERLLKQSHHWMMRFAVYMERMRIDEVSEPISWNDIIADLEERAIYWMLCKLRNTMDGHGFELGGLVGREIIENDEYHLTRNLALRRYKNLIVLRDLKRALLYIETAFDVLIADNMST